MFADMSTVDLLSAPAVADMATVVAVMPVTAVTATFVQLSDCALASASNTLASFHLNLAQQWDGSRSWRRRYSVMRSVIGWTTASVWKSAREHPGGGG